MVPSVEITLRSVTLQGSWVMLDRDLSKVLTAYASNLRSLKVDWIHAISARKQTLRHSVRFQDAITDAIGLRGGSDKVSVAKVNASFE